MAIRPCKVIISGGGITGLSLALMLEKEGLDYVLLEAYPHIVSNKSGAGICMLPNGLRILDQLGCYEDLLRLVGHPVDIINVRNPQGESLSCTEEWHKRTSERIPKLFELDNKANLNRYGYNPLWCHRHIILQVIYDQIQDKSKILTQKKVHTVQHTGNEVEVTTTDGYVYRGDMVIGADGVHSRIRQQMAQRASEVGISEQYTEENGEISALVPSTYCCLYGSSSNVSGIPKATLDFLLNKKFSYVIGSGHEDRVYWALMVKLQQTFHGSEIPRFSDQDMEKVIQEHWNDPIAPGVNFSDLYNNRLSRTFLKPMREFIYKKWHLDRMMIIGEAAHQMTIMIAQGGNQAIESAAALTNSLKSALSGSTTAGRLSCQEIQCIFEEVQNIRSPRVKTIMERSHQRQLMDSMDTPELEELMLNKFPKMLPGVIVDRWDQTFRSAISLQNFEISERGKTSFWSDEQEK
ncbi:monooxygenase [Penicillium macrosclerotiorum]|uniref:monooxygenase n=1 Tax=Penicillium macrosclerotiorum TaxID=303699 RepID=UPI002548CDA9|nr:monooxygenase [Penicillium macrosclerotiorum]KAJ5679112.1 monooxygenase [Penicillium macrosclerotiorum]